ncbi:MAG: SDR family oxidoreductase [Candidatus Melainabacteria bacterium]|nr:SDR family oxidoreductase [Candidatus Melainabacteria bacterium]
MDLGINGKKALVCGASKGIGRAIALELAREGVEPILCARKSDVLEETAAAIRKETGVRVHHKACDLTLAKDRDELIKAVDETLKGIDILVLNTGGPKPSSALATTLDEWENGFHQLFQMIVHLNSGFIPKMKEKKWGRIVCVTSLSVMEPIANLAISNSMRSGVTAMLKTLSDELAQSGITINCLAPGAIATERLEELMDARIAKTGQSKEDYMKQYLSAIPMGRMGDPEEFAAMAAFLCSQRASYITGSTIAIDGGKRRSTY